MSNQEKSYTLKPSWKKYIPYYLLCLLLMPLFGIGLLLAAFIFMIHYTAFYRITDDKIMIKKFGKEPVSLSIIGIDSTRTEYSWLDQQIGIGSLVITHQKDTAEYILDGLVEPEKLRSALDLAIQQERKHREQKKDVEDYTPPYSPGTLDPMNELVGLWQQGLITDEQFEEEKKKFEN